MVGGICGGKAGDNSGGRSSNTRVWLAAIGELRRASVVVATRSCSVAPLSESVPYLLLLLGSHSSYLTLSVVVDAA